MKLSARPLSSPGRVEKFPPPLMRFLRSNAASRSRGSRSRASPIFVKQRTGAAAVGVETTKEPSSPKVTCMGQVRARRSKKGPRKPGRPGRRRCRWFPRILFCRNLKGGVGFSFSCSKSCTPGWPKWGSFFRCGSSGGSVKWGFGGKDENFEHSGGGVGGEEEDDEEIGAKVDDYLGFSPCAPPKNALILTRCRSAPYTSSSLASRFWGSPLGAEKAEHLWNTEQPRKTEVGKGENGGAEGGDEQKLANSDGNQDRECKTDTEGERMTPWISKEYGGSTGDDEAAKSENGEEDVKTGDGEAEVVRPLMLTRCKSEPARTGEKLDPEMGFWRTARFGIVDSCSPRAL